MPATTTLSPGLIARIVRKPSPRRRQIKMDPVLGPTTSLASTLSAAPKIDGSILHLAIVEAVSANPKVVILSKQEIPITDSAQRLVDGGIYATCLGVNLEFAGPVVRTIEVDLIVIDPVNKTATAYEIKRGGECDSGTRHKIVRNLILVKLVLANYLKTLGHDVNNVEVGLIVYYGTWSLKPIPTITQETIDAHFGVPVTPTVAMAAELMRQQTLSTLMPMLGTLLEGLAAELIEPAKAEDRRALIDLLNRTLRTLDADHTSTDPTDDKNSSE